MPLPYGAGGAEDGGAAHSSAAAETRQPCDNDDAGQGRHRSGGAAAAPAGAGDAAAARSGGAEDEEDEEDAHDATALPTAALRAAALRLFGETAPVRHAALSQLRAALAALPPPPAAACAAPPPPPLDTRDAALLCLLRARSFDVAAAAALAANGRAFHAAHPSYFRLSRETLLAVAASAFLVVLPALSHGGHRVMALQPARMPLDTFPPEHLIGFQLWVLARLQRDPAVQVHGLASLSSYDGLSASMFWRQFRLMPLATRIAYQRDCYTPRYGPIYVWSLPRVGAVFAAVKRLLPASTTAHVRLHGAVGAGGEAGELLPLRHVPRAFGGQLEDEALHMRAWMERQVGLEDMGM
jgi:hypothetical protein